MAGYMTKLQGYVYDGELTHAITAGVENGILLVRGTTTNAGKLIAPAAADTTSKFICVGTTDVYGKPAYRFAVNKLNDNYYFVENVFEYNDADPYDLTTYVTPAGEKLRAHPLVVGDEFITDKVTGTITVGTAYGVKTDGTIG